MSFTDRDPNCRDPHPSFTTIWYCWYILPSYPFNSLSCLIGWETDTAYYSQNLQSFGAAEQWATPIPVSHSSTQRARRADRGSSNGLEVRVWREGQGSGRNSASLNSRLFFLPPTLDGFWLRKEVSEKGKETEGKKNHRRDFVSFNSVLGRVPLISLGFMGFSGCWWQISEFHWLAEVENGTVLYPAIF